MPQSHPTTGPVRLWSPALFLVRKAEWSARRNFASVLFSWSHQTTGPARLDTATYLWFGWIIRRTPRVPRSMSARASYGPRTGIFNVFQECRTAPLRTRKGIAQPELAKIPHGRRLWPYGTHTGPVPSPHGLFTGCLWYLNPYGARKLLRHTLKLYGPRTRRQNSYGAARDPHGTREWTYDFCSKQPGNNPGTTRSGPRSVIWLGHYNACIKTLRGPYGEAKFVRRRTGPVRAPWVDVRFLFDFWRFWCPGVWYEWGITHCRPNWRDVMMTSSNGNIFRATGPLCGEFTGQRWIPLTKASDAELLICAWING